MRNNDITSTEQGHFVNVAIIFYREYLRYVLLAINVNKYMEYDFMDWL